MERNKGIFSENETLTLQESYELCANLYIEQMFLKHSQMSDSIIISVSEISNRIQTGHDYKNNIV